MFIQQRSGGGSRLVTSASDLTAASICEFAFLRRVDAKLGRDVEVPADDDPMLARAAVLGLAHEARVLQELREEFGEAIPGSPGGVAEIPEANPRTSEVELEVAAQRTIAALQDGADIVFQATFFDPEQLGADVATAPGEPEFIEIGFVGFADFLQRLPGGEYEVQDTKLARRAKVTALMQLAAYAEQLERIGVPVAAEATLILGDGARSRHRIADIAPVFRRRRARLHTIVRDRARAVGADHLRESAAPVAWGAEGVSACGRCEVCEPEIVRTRDPLLIAGIRRSQRDALVAAGFDTIEAVSAMLEGSQNTEAHACVSFPPEVPGLSGQTVERLSAQARLQLDAVQGAAPPVRVIDARALAAIPQPNPGDIFFDFEGDPMYREPGPDASARWGIDYLFGLVDTDEHFTAIWAHTLEDEKQALLDFLALVKSRRAQFPAMRIYHYAAYERTHLLSIAARHGVGEAEVDDLLRNHVLVDLYPIVRRALRVGSRSYSIKKLEPLYMGDELRDDDGVTNAAQSVTEYAEATALLAQDDLAERGEGQRRLDAIADYNRYDCVSTLRLRDWLLSIAAEHHVAPYPPQTIQVSETPELELSAVADSLMRHASLAGNSSDRNAAALAASAIDYHQREQKSFWWAHFARLVDPIEDWADTRDVLIVDRRSSAVSADWFLPNRARAERRHVRLRGEIAPGSNFSVGRESCLQYEYPAPFPPQPGAEPGARGTRWVTIVERHEDGVTVEEFLSSGVERYDDMPLALVPGRPPRLGAQRSAIEEWGRALTVALDRGEYPRDPVVDLMRRTPPRLVHDSVGGPSMLADMMRRSADPIAAVTEAVLRLDRSYLAVQGPPGTGKTYLAARVIKRLVEEFGWRVGVVAQSHRVVENVLTGVVDAGLPSERVAKVPQGGTLAEGMPVPAYTVLRKNAHRVFLQDHETQGRGCVIGGTAWDFANQTRVDRQQLDLLVIDEAGQFSLAPTIAASVSAKRLLLLGDPQQLPQVSQGAHPEPVDTSALGWLLGEHETIPEELGVFLAETRRMRPELADVVSELAYEGRLRSHPTASQRSVEGAGSPGLIWHPVAHAGNSTSSPEEAAVVLEIANHVLRGTLHEPEREPRALTQRDLIVVAAYNAQVECVAQALAEAGLGEIRVGTVDRFQGQEAVVAIVTLAASSAEDVPRGLEFLLLRNRLNVAISRAQWSAHLVSSDRLGEGLPSSAEGLTALSGYLRLTERGAPAGGARETLH